MIELTAAADAPGGVAPGQPGAGVEAASMLGALAIVARHRGIHLSPAQLRREHRLGSGEPSLQQLLDIARASGMRAAATRLKFRDLMRLGAALPAILLLKNGTAMALLRCEPQAQPPQVVLQDPIAGEGALLTLDGHRLGLGWVGDVILIKRDYRLRDEDQPFGLGLILSQLLRDRHIARDIAVAAITLSILALGPIMFWRILIDRVLYYRSFDTLAVMCAAMAVLIIFETVFGYMRRLLVLHVTARIDAKLSTYMFNKALSLPLDFFERSSNGVIARDMNEIFRIRNFLTGQLFGTLLDSCVLLIFLPIMFFFSPTLTAVVLGFCALICVWIMWMLPALRRKGAAVFKAEGAKNAFLIESLQGIRSVKSLALDARQCREWDVRVAEAARRRLEEGRTANVIQTVVTPLERDGQRRLCVVILSGDCHQRPALCRRHRRVHDADPAGSLPLIQLSHLLQQYDEAQLRSGRFQRRQPACRGRRSGRRPHTAQRPHRVRGCASLSRCATPALDGVSQRPRGRSSASWGAAVPARAPWHACCRCWTARGADQNRRPRPREIDIDHLRSSSAWYHRNASFSGTIRDSIAAAKPDATFEDIVYGAAGRR
jgi:ATP-binding cassette subfamily B protein